MFEELGIKSKEYHTCNGEVDEIYEIRYCNFLFNQLIICEYTQTFFALVDLMIQTILYELKIAQGVNLETQNAHFIGQTTSVFCNIFLVTSIVIRYIVWFKWA